jgi:hypothetical protein
MDTDGGNLIAVNDIPLNYVTSNTKIKYFIKDDLLIIATTEGDNSVLSSLAIVNKELDTLLFEQKESRYYNYYLSKPLINERYSDLLEIKDNKIYITYTMNNKNNKFVLNNGKYINDLKEDEYTKYNITKNTLLEYTYEITNQDDKLSSRKIFEYKVEDYIKK